MIDLFFQCYESLISNNNITKKTVHFLSPRSNCWNFEKFKLGRILFVCIRWTVYNYNKTVTREAGYNNIKGEESYAVILKKCIFCSSPLYLLLRMVGLIYKLWWSCFHSWNSLFCMMVARTYFFWQCFCWVTYDYSTFYFFIKKNHPYFVSIFIYKKIWPVTVVTFFSFVLSFESVYGFMFMASSEDS